jgi:Ni/Fe-hydrogenase subunit HybB-like protein
LRSQLVKLIARIGFFFALVITLPLAVHNRQLIDIHLNPFSLLETPDSSITLPLFVALLLALGLGLIIGYATGRLARRSKASKSDRTAADILSRMPKAPSPTRADTQTMLEKRDSSMTD